MAAGPPQMKDWYSRQGVQVKGGGITLQHGGSVKGGQTDYATGTGFFLGYSGGAYKFSIGDTTKYLRWDGTNLYFTGDVSGASGTFSGSITLTGSGAIKGGMTAYNTGNGFWMGYDSGAYKFSIGNSAGQNIRWDGTSLVINGSIDFSTITGSTKPADNADVTLSAVNGGLAVTGGGITLTSGGAIKGGQTAYATGTGFFLGYSASDYKFSIGSSTKYLRWNGTNLLINGDIETTGTAQFDGQTIGGSVTAAVVANFLQNAPTGVYAKASSGGGTAVLGVGGTSGNGIVGSSQGASYYAGNFLQTAAGTALLAEATGTSSGAAKFHNYNGGGTTTREFWACPTNYAAYTPTGKGDWYCANNVYGNGVILTFTGGHLALVPTGTGVLGDILLDDEILEQPDVNNAYGTVVLSSSPNQKGALGVLSSSRSLTTDTYPDEISPEIWDEYHLTHDLATVNGVGEGCINVCGEGGDIEKGDLIVTSSIPGKGMKQSDDIVRNYTVAKARESVSFAPGEVKMIACIYVCG